MSVISSAEPDVVRIKVYKPSENAINNGYEPGTSKKFCIDPRLASYRTIQCLISQAFDIKTDFTIYAVHRCSTDGLKKLTAIWSDCDLEKAIKNATSDSYLRLSYELSPQEEGLDDWDFVALNDLSTNIRWFNVDNRSIIATVKPTAGKTPSALNKAIKFIDWMYGGRERHGSKPVDENDFKKFLDSEGRLIHTNELRQAIYEGGVEPSFRKIIWRHLLNIFPINMTSSERVEYLKDVSIEYEKLKGRWREEQQHNENIRLIMRTIYTDVLRTDRTFGFYATSDDTNINLQSLYHILITYCISHPNITYCQGMNEYASTLLYVMRDESLAYLCFCSIMRRIRANFSTDGVAIATKLHHLKVLLQAVDPVYWNFLESCDAVNLYFAYRWLLLECKREVPFNEALRVLEVMWATLPIASEPPPLSEISLLSISSDNTISDIRYPTVCRSLQRRALSCPQLSIIDKSCSHQHRHLSFALFYDNDNDNKEGLSSSTQQVCNSMVENDEYQVYQTSNNNNNNNSNSMSTKSREKSLENSFSLSEISEFDSNNLSKCPNDNCKSNNTDSQCSSSTNWLQHLPMDSKIWLEEDNSFLLFLCISILLTHRTHLLKQKHLDEQEISIHFDRYRRRHNAERLLTHARTLYEQYIQWSRKKRMLDDLNSYSVS
ncbi:unnamed protein product [Rotaria sp. Silwood1]|nr:unnamed protein product [Rotaria sp. Silwood1]CAF1027386.1 unnamed protein product [Rotaria sp. Silwood1]CAF3421638.1 unnamed protein product [Rotaria sp. Silwood1]CAF3425992.1 unnamed protein product [Rotaria sp. Silwood1]CAF4607467.1 unnamed protein product [Rotaria sp. Silwood1]